MDCFDRPVKTCQNILWFCKHGLKGRNRTVKIVYFSLNSKSFPIQCGFDIEKRCIPPHVGVCGRRNFHQFLDRYARKPFKGSKDVDFGLVYKKT